MKLLYTESLLFYKGFSGSSRWYIENISPEMDNIILNIIDRITKALVTDIARLMFCS